MRPVVIQVHPKFKEILQLKASMNGQSMIKYTESIVTKNDPVTEIASQWREKYNYKTKKQGHLDLP